MTSRSYKVPIQAKFSFIFSIILKQKCRLEYLEEIHHIKKWQCYASSSCSLGFISLLSLLYPTSPSPSLHLSSSILAPGAFPDLPAQVRTPSHRISAHHLSLPHWPHHLCNFPIVWGLFDKRSLYAIRLQVPKGQGPLCFAYGWIPTSESSSPWLSAGARKLVLCYLEGKLRQAFHPQPQAAWLVKCSH